MATNARFGPAAEFPQSDIAVSVVVPVYNERENLPQLLEEIDATFHQPGMAQYRPYELLFVNDGSTDGSAEWLATCARSNEHVRTYRLGRSFGQSAALAAGIDHADGDVIVPMDGDLQNDAADIPALLDRLADGYDCVSGWRRDRDDPWHKTIPSAIQTQLAMRIGPEIHDYGCTLKAYRADAIKDICLYGEGHRYIPAKLYDKGYSVTELEVTHRPRVNGESHYGVGRLLRGFVDFMFHLFWVRYSTRPLHLFGGLGLLAMVAGTGLGALSLFQKYLLGVSLGPRTPRLILITLLIVVGLHLVMFGTLWEMLTKLHYRDDPEYRISEVIE